LQQTQLERRLGEPSIWGSLPGAALFRRGSTVRRLLRLKLARFALAFIALITATGVFAPVVAPYDPNELTTFTSEGPSLSHLLGTDPIGRDQLSRLLYGARASLQVSFSAAAIAIVFGSLLGLISAYFKGFLDFAIMRTVDALLAMPGLILPLTLLAALGGGLDTVTVALAIGYTPVIARLMRGQALSVMERDYVLAAESLGASTPRVILRHIGPNSFAPIIVAGSLAMSFAVIAEAGLSFLGVGIAPPTPTWGTMLSTGFTYLRTTPWVVAAPGISIFLLVLSFNFLGDALRDVLDPRLRGRI
jgi:peptide/nickel transport system permease protein